MFLRHRFTRHVQKKYAKLSTGRSLKSFGTPSLLSWGTGATHIATRTSTNQHRIKWENITIQSHLQQEQFQAFECRGGQSCASASFPLLFSPVKMMPIQQTKKKAHSMSSLVAWAVLRKFLRTLHSWHATHAAHPTHTPCARVFLLLPV